VIVFRLSKSKFAKDLSEKGAELAGGRWNSKGNALIYTSESRALCTAEIAVHIPLGIIPSNYDIISIKIPDKLIQVLDTSILTNKWKRFPHSEETQKIGDKFLADNEFVALKVPSSVIQDENNIVINPKHPKFKEIKILSIEPYAFDERLFNKQL